MRRLSIIAAACIAASFAQAQPSVSGTSGTFSHGGSVTISGASFGSRSVEAQSFFEDWDWGVAETAIDTAGSPWSAYGAGSYGEPCRFSDEVIFGGSGSSLRWITPDRIDGSSLLDGVTRSGLDIDEGEQFYFSMHLWSTYAGADEHQSDCPQQWKIVNFVCEDAISGSPTWYWNWNESGFDNTGTPPNGAPRFIVYRDMTTYTSGGLRVQPPQRQWWQIEVEGQASSDLGVADATFRVWQSGQLAEEWTGVVSHQGAEFEADIASVGALYNFMLIHNYIQYTTCLPSSYPDTAYYEDVALQVGSWARVALGDASTWANCTTRYYQDVASWSASSITITANVGEFSGSETAYLYVIDSSGNRSSGYPVTIGGGGQSTPDIQSATRSGGLAELVFNSGDGGPYMVWLQASGQDVRALATTDTTATLPMSSAATDVTVKDGTSQRKTSIPE